MKFRKKPVVIEAVQWTGENLSELYEFMGYADNDVIRECGWNPSNAWASYKSIVERDGLSIDTLEGVMHADIGDWIILGVKGEFYPCKDNIFKLTYDVVE